MDNNKLRYQLYLERAVMQAHINSLDDAIAQIETQTDGTYPIDENELFMQYLDFLKRKV